MAPEATPSDEADIAWLMREVARIPVPVAEPDRAGQRVGPFRIKNQLGRGAMGVVYAAEDVRLRRTVALKVLPEALVSDSARRARFLREARSASAIHHANVATVFEVGESDGVVFIAMEHIEGETLRAHLASRVRLTWTAASRIVREIAGAVGRAHAQGIVHRDLKPDNVMIRADGVVKVLDFGLAKLTGEARRLAVTAPNQPASEPIEPPIEEGSFISGVGAIVGTSGYMSPEQARGESVDPRADVFALGVILYELVVGSRPFSGRTFEATKPRSSRGRSSSPGDDPAGVDLRALTKLAPKSFVAIVARCLRASSEGRFADASAIETALAAVEASHSGRLRRAAGIAIAASFAAAALIVGGRLASVRGESIGAEHRGGTSLEPSRIQALRRLAREVPEVAPSAARTDVGAADAPASVNESNAIEQPPGFASTSTSSSRARRATDASPARQTTPTATPAASASARAPEADRAPAPVTKSSGDVANRVDLGF